MIPGFVPFPFRSFVSVCICVFLRFGERTVPSYLPTALKESKHRAFRVYLSMMLKVVFVSSFLNSCVYFTKNGECMVPVRFGGDRGVFHQSISSVACSLIFKTVRKNSLVNKHQHILCTHTNIHTDTHAATMATSHFF